MQRGAREGGEGIEHLPANERRWQVEGKLGAQRYGGGKSKRKRISAPWKNQHAHDTDQTKEDQTDLEKLQDFFEKTRRKDPQKTQQIKQPTNMQTPKRTRTSTCS